MYLVLNKSIYNYKIKLCGIKYKKKNKHAPTKKC